jgi:hypothetical protein
MNRQWMLVGVLTAGLLLTQAAGTSSLSPRLPAYGTADRYEDLVIGVPNDKFDEERPGAVAAVYGGPSPGLTGGNTLWTQHPLLPDNDDDGDLWGKALAAGDFDGDGWYDLAVGAPREDLWSISNVGAVDILYGSAAGWPTRFQLFHQNLLTDAEDGDQYGWAVAAGDFDGDGYDDLAVGVPEEDIGGKAGAGQVDVYYGTPSGPTGGAGRQELDQDILGVNWGIGGGDNFGWALATGDFDRDGYDDLAVGVPEEDSLVALDIGVVNIVYGTGAGLKSMRAQQWHQNAGDILDGADPGDQFGKALVTGDFNRDGYADLAVGVPYEDKGTTADAGAVSVLYGSDSGLTDTGNQFFQQRIGNSDNAEKDDRLGWALAAGDFDGDRFADLAIGAHYEDVGAKVNAGAVSVLYGASSGLYSKHDRWFHQDLLDTYDGADAGDWFGFALTAGDFDGNGCDDLAVGVPLEDIGAWPDDNGLVNVVFGSTYGLGLVDQEWWQGKANVAGDANENDQFGWALASIPTRKYPVHLPLVLRGAP